MHRKVVTWFSPVGFQYWPKISFNPIAIVTSLFDSEEKRQVWLYTLSSFSFLSLLSPGAMAAIVLDLAQYFSTGPEFSRMWSPFMHHRAILALFVCLGALEAFDFFRKKISLFWVTLVLVVMTLVFQFVYHFPLNKLTKYEYWKYENWMGDNEKLIKEIPISSGIATQQSLISHLSHRKKYILYGQENMIFQKCPAEDKLLVAGFWWKARVFIDRSSSKSMGDAAT